MRNATVCVGLNRQMSSGVRRGGLRVLEGVKGAGCCRGGAEGTIVRTFLVALPL